MPLWIELTVLLLIVYGGVVAVMMAWLERRARLVRLIKRRAKRQTGNRPAATEEQMR